MSSAWSVRLAAKIGKIRTEQAVALVRSEASERLRGILSAAGGELPQAIGMQSAIGRRHLESARGWWHGIRWRGTNLPGVVTAGTFYKDGGRMFWDIHNPERTVVISLADEDYTQSRHRIENPRETVEAINSAVAAAQAG